MFKLFHFTSHGASLRKEELINSVCDSVIVKTASKITLVRKYISEKLMFLYILIHVALLKELDFTLLSYAKVEFC